MHFPQLTIRDRTYAIPIIQGGMGVGVSREKLAGSVAKCGGVGTLSSACLDTLVSHDIGRKINTFDAMLIEVQNARTIACNSGSIGVNIMAYLAQTFAASVHGAIEAGANMIVCGAGLPLHLPEIVGKANIALIPIVSSLRALQLICARWEKKGRRPDAVIVEGPLAGGHLGFAYDDIFKPEYQLEEIFPSIKEFAIAHGNFPVIVAGGIYSYEDVCNWIANDADGVQMGTRFLATTQSSASERYKQAVINCTHNDIIVCHNVHKRPGSPSGMPFRTLRTAPMYAFCNSRKPLCNRGYVLQKNKEGTFTLCGAKSHPHENFCICNGLLASAGYVNNELSLYTVGAHAHRIDRITSVQELMSELTNGTA